MSGNVNQCSSDNDANKQQSNSTHAQHNDAHNQHGFHEGRKLLNADGCAGHFYFFLYTPARTYTILLPRYGTTNMIFIQDECADNFFYSGCAGMLLNKLKLNTSFTHNSINATRMNPEIL